MREQKKNPAYYECAIRKFNNMKYKGFTDLFKINRENLGVAISEKDHRTNQINEMTLMISPEINGKLMY